MVLINIAQCNLSTSLKKKKKKKKNAMHKNFLLGE
jgi:hypothetical protein